MVTKQFCNDISIIYRRSDGRLTLFKDCIDCKKRYVGCHSECESYLRDKAIKDKQREEPDEYIDYISDRLWREGRK